MIFQCQWHIKRNGFKKLSTVCPLFFCTTLHNHKTTFLYYYSYTRKADQLKVCREKSDRMLFSKLLVYFLIYYSLLFFSIPQRLACCSASAKSFIGPFLVRGGTDWSGSRWYCFSSCQWAKSDLAERAGKNMWGFSLRFCSKVWSVGFELDLIFPKSSSSALL